jgi:hypothetical protein
MTAHQLDLLTWGTRRARPDRPRGSPATKAAWLRGHLEDGTLTRPDVAEALAIDLPDVDRIMAGRVTLANTAWRKIEAAEAISGRQGGAGGGKFHHLR